MIPSVAIKHYLARELDDHRWVKSLGQDELEAVLGSLRPRPEVSPRLRAHQRACFVLGVANPQFCFWNDMGSGKSLLALELLRYWYRIGRIRRALIFVTSDKAYPTWERQFREFEIDVPYASLEGSSEDKWGTLRELGEGLALVHYPGAVAMACRRVGGKGTKKHKMALDPERVAELREWADGIVLDESTKCGHHTSLTYKLVEALSRGGAVRYALAGRPHGRDPTMLWPQYKLIDGGETLGATLGLFRATFFEERKIRWDPTGRAREYKFRDSMRDELSRMLQHRSIMYSADECVGLPPVVSEVVRAALPEEAGLYYEHLVKRVIEARGNLREMKNVFTRMRQVSSGFVGFMDDESGARAEVEFADNPKLDTLLELVDETPEERQVVIFYEFTRSGRLIAEALRARGESCIWLWSGTKDSRGDLARFMVGGARIAVVNNRVGAYSLDGLQVANYQFFYESPVSAIDREQAERRLVRDGQKRTVFRYDLVVEDTMDDRILEFHKEGESLFDALLRDPSKVVGRGRPCRSTGKAS